MKNKVQLITYVNRLAANNLTDLSNHLKGPLSGLFGAVHLLPFYYPIDGSDAGFDPIDHTQVDPRLGVWSDITEIAEHTDVMADVIVNHMSVESAQFQDFSRRGIDSEFSKLFLTESKVFPNGITSTELQAIYRPRPGRPFTKVTLANGETIQLWTTFTAQQADIDVEAEPGIAYLDSILGQLAQSKVKSIRLDAVGYAIKRAGTNCFMMPETFEFIDQFAARAKTLGIEVLVEVHSYYQTQIDIASRVDWVYDFALPPLVLHAFAFQTAHALKNWIELRPSNALTVLDTHDGIGVIDIGADPSDREARPGLVSPNEINELVEWIHNNSNGQSKQATGAAASNLDLYQVNCTFFDALGGHERKYLLARAIQFFLPGIPQVYYVGLLAGKNDMSLLETTKVGRDINRQYFSPVQFNDALNKSVVQKLFALIRLRNEHPAFGGRFYCKESADHILSLMWSVGTQWAQLEIDFLQGLGQLRYSEFQGSAQFSFE
jgi:sucrose phosphorylase